MSLTSALIKAIEKAIVKTDFSSEKEIAVLILGIGSIIVVFIVIELFKHKRNTNGSSKSESSNTTASDARITNHSRENRSITPHCENSTLHHRTMAPSHIIAYNSQEHDEEIVANLDKFNKAIAQGIKEKDHNGWSFSSIAKYEKCPAQFYFSYIEKISINDKSDTTTSSARTIGKIIHSTAEYAINSLVKEGRHKPIEDLVRHYQEVGPTSNLSKQSQSQINQMLETFYRFYLSIDRTAVSEAEIHGKTPSGNAFFGKVDLVMTQGVTWKLLDLKTGSDKMHGDIFDDLMQAKIYAGMIARHGLFNFKEYTSHEFGLFYLKTEQMKTFLYNEKSIEEALSKFDSWITKIRSATEFPKNSAKNPLCAYCDYQPVCQSKATTLKDHIQAKKAA